jgi:HD superfamily phosphodiesterase
MRCPGQDTQYWKPGAIFEVKCPECNQPVEFFKDDTTRRCGHCGHRFVNPQMDFGCAAYCPYAEQCLGTMPEELLAQKEDLLKDRVAIEMKRYFKGDFKRIGHASRRARYAERIAKEAGAALPVVLCAAYLRDIGAPEAQRKNAEVTTAELESESPVVAEEILSRLKARDELIEAVCRIVANHRKPQNDADRNLSIVYDADRIAWLEEQHKKNPVDAERLGKLINNELLTAAGRQEARRILIK